MLLCTVAKRTKMVGRRVEKAVPYLAKTRTYQAGNGLDGVSPCLTIDGIQLPATRTAGLLSLNNAIS